jgi:hypothetical protein
MLPLVYQAVHLTEFEEKLKTELLYYVAISTERVNHVIFGEKLKLLMWLPGVKG